MKPAFNPLSAPQTGPNAATRRVVIAGMGLISPLGHGAWATFRALLGGATVADRLDNLEPDTDPTPLAQAVGGVSVARHSATDPAVDLAERALREAVAEAGLDPRGLPTWLGTSKGAVVALTRAAEAHDRNELSVENAAAVALGPHGLLAHDLTRRTGIDVRAHAVAACASGLFALHRAAETLRRGDAEAPDAALVVSCESALLPAFVHSYQRLGVLAPLTRDGYRARPLDAARNGFVLGETGVAVVLRALEPGTAPAPGETELLATATAHHPGDLIRSDPDSRALKQVVDELAPAGPFAAVHPHAPGTAEHDGVELALLDGGLGGRGGGDQPDTYAVKGALGHSLGASGLVALVIATLCGRTRRVPPMPWLDQPLPAAGLRCRPEGGAITSGPHAVFAAGFGGHVAGAAIGRHPSGTR